MIIVIISSEKVKLQFCSFFTGDTLHRLMEDPAADTTCYKLKVSCLAVLVLHEDPAHTPGDAIEPGFSSADKLTQMADKFFGRVQGINTSGAVDSLPELRTKYAEACPFDHIRCDIHVYIYIFF